MALGSSLFYSLCLLLSMTYIMRHIIKIREDSNFFLILICIGVLATGTVLITQGDLSLATTLSLLSRFLLVYVSISIDKEMYLQRLLKMCFVFACISLVIFLFVNIAGVEAAEGIFSNLYEIKNTLSWMHSSYGVLLICWNFRDALRNSYMFGEPGLYQMVPIMALYFILFRCRYFSQKQRIKYIIVFVVTLLTVQSTSGFMNMIVLFMMAILSNQQSISKNIKRVLLAIVVLGSIYFLFWAGEDSIFYTAFINKITGDRGTIDFTVTTGADRVSSILNLGRMLSSRPVDMLFGVGYQGIVRYLREYTCSGIVNSIMMFGILNACLLYGFMGKSIIVGVSNGYEAIFLLFMILNNGFSQPDLLAITSVIVCLYLWMNRRYGIEKGR